jgi:hypothetical protein
MYVLLGVIYLLLFVILGLKTFKNRRWVLFGVGFIFPITWIIGGVMPPRGMSKVDALYAERDRRA